MDDIKRLMELALRSYNNGIFTFTDFLSLNELSIYLAHEREFSFACPVLFGGTESAERKLIRFGDPIAMGYSEDFPISALTIRPINSRFSDSLSHRDFLGALMSLGIKREMIGDIFVRENEAVIFLKDSIRDYVIENLNRIKHTSVEVFRSSDRDLSGIALPVLEDRLLQVSSPRIDAVISKAYKLSRNEAERLFPAGLVFLNGRECTENAKTLKAGDIVSVRKRGKFEYSGEKGLSKKGKVNCLLRIYT